VHAKITVHPLKSCHIYNTLIDFYLNGPALCPKLSYIRY